MPTCLIAGCMWPREFMPDFMLKLSNFVPQTWILKGLSNNQRCRHKRSIYPLHNTPCVCNYILPNRSKCTKAQAKLAWVPGTGERRFTLFNK
jgi:hypothetical protein